MSIEEKKARKAAYMREYQKKNRERIAQTERERYHRKKAKAKEQTDGY